MYIQSLNQNYYLELCLFLLFLALVGDVFALSTDKQQDMEIEADTAEMDDKEGITIYRGNVIVTQGSMRITGNVLTIHFNDNEDMELAIMQGNPATYRQLPDDSKEYDEAESLKMEFYALKDYIILTDKAVVKKPDGSRLTGSRIEYDTVLGRTKATRSVTTAGSSNQVNNTEDDNRVKITIKKKKQD